MRRPSRNALYCARWRFRSGYTDGRKPLRQQAHPPRSIHADTDYPRAIQLRR